MIQVGGLADLLHTEEVTGSIPVSPTMFVQFRRPERVGRSVVEVRVDPQVGQGRSAEETRTDEGDAVSIQDLEDLFAALLPSGDRHFGDGVEARHGVVPVTVGVMGALVGRQHARDRGEAAQRH
ncbi:hypothetical protein [Microbispora bryophytorum]|uniref:hypothetical protein n=1 Tax=Microbispora bryophytorum TaxID=1460882 RepID=UPI00340C11CA